MVADIVSALLSRGFKPGDRVASYASNCIVGRLSRVLPELTLAAGKRGGVSGNCRPRWHLAQRLRGFWPRCCPRKVAWLTWRKAPSDVYQI